MTVFRADGNSAIGSGHVMRCLSIAEAARARGCSCHFVLAGDEMTSAVRGKGFNFTVLGTDYRTMEQELALLNDVLLALSPHHIVVDSYFVTTNYLAALGNYAPVTYLDDIAAFAYPVETVVNYNLFAQDMNYVRLYTAPQFSHTMPKLLLGAKYAPLREEFCHATKDFIQIRPVANVLVSTGGADPEHLALCMVRGLMNQMARFEKLRFHFVLGPLYPDVEEINAVTHGSEKFVVHQNVQKMSELMRNCQIAVSAAGSTLYELCACGVPTVTYVIADNQLKGALAFEKHGLMLSAGDCRTDPEAMIYRVFDLMETLIVDDVLRSRIIQRMRQTIDGCGARRIVDHLLQCAHKE